MLNLIKSYFLKDCLIRSGKLLDGSNFERVNDGVSLVSSLLLWFVNWRSQLNSLESGHWVLSEHLPEPISDSEELLFLVDIHSLEEHAVATGHLDHAISIIIRFQDGGLSLGSRSKRVVLLVSLAVLHSAHVQAPSLSSDMCFLMLDKQRRLHWHLQGWGSYEQRGRRFLQHGLFSRLHF